MFMGHQSSLCFNKDELPPHTVNYRSSTNDWLVKYPPVPGHDLTMNLLDLAESSTLSCSKNHATCAVLVRAILHKTSVTCTGPNGQRTQHINPQCDMQLAIQAQ